MLPKKTTGNGEETKEELTWFQGPLHSCVLEYSLPNAFVHQIKM